MQRIGIYGDVPSLPHTLPRYLQGRFCPFHLYRLLTLFFGRILVTSEVMGYLKDLDLMGCNPTQFCRYLCSGKRRCLLWRVGEECRVIIPVTRFKFPNKLKYYNFSSLPKLLDSKRLYYHYHHRQYPHMPPNKNSELFTVCRRGAVS